MGKENDQASTPGRITLNLNFTIKENLFPPYEQPSYDIDKNLQRFDERETAFNSVLFQEKVLQGVPWRVKSKETADRKRFKEVPGHRLIEYAFKEASWTSYELNNIMSWEEKTPSRQISADLIQKEQAFCWEASPHENNHHLKKVATFFGAIAVGITTVKESWFYSHNKEGLPIVFSSGHDKPLITAEANIIPSSMNRVIVILVPQDIELMAFAPSQLAGAATGLGYSRMAEVASKTVTFIRKLGYSAIPIGNDTCLSVPLAIDAGLGELGRHGMLINPYFGSMVRICKVITDFPLIVDKPISFGAAEYCSNCTICAKSCPSRAISFNRETAWESVCPSCSSGVKKWYVSGWDCLKYWVYSGTSCGLCQVVCPFNKQAGTEKFQTRSNLKCNDPEKWWNTNTTTPN
jgi:epoxyqueuosine reductase